MTAKSDPPKKRGRPPKKKAAPKKAAKKTAKKKRIPAKAPVFEPQIVEYIDYIKPITGRPPKITKEYGDKLAPTLPELFADGSTLKEVVEKLNISTESFYSMCAKSQEFSKAYKKGIDVAEAWWCRLGRAGAAGKIQINPATWIFNMKNRFGWKDKIEAVIDVGVKVEFNPEEELKKRGIPIPKIETDDIDADFEVIETEKIK